MGTIKLSSISTYQNCLGKLLKLNIDLDNSDVMSIDKTFDDNDIPDSSRQLYYNSLLWYRKNKCVNDDELSDIRLKINDLRDSQMNKYSKNELSDKENKNFTIWDNIVKVHSILPKQSIDHVLLSLYVYNPPRRLEYAGMIINDNISISGNDIIISDDIRKNKIHTHVQPSDGSDNYYVRRNETSFFVFNKYKTEKTYGRQIIELNHELHNVMSQYINKEGLKNGDKLFNFPQNTLARKLRNIFESKINKCISVSLLRHIYISYMYDGNNLKTVLDKYVLGQKMGHSIEMQSFYNKNINVNDYINDCDKMTRNEYIDVGNMNNIEKAIIDVNCVQDEKPSKSIKEDAKAKRIKVRERWNKLMTMLK